MSTVQSNRSSSLGAVAAALGILVVVLAGCKPYYPTSTSDSFKGIWGTWVRLLEKRAPYDLNCPAEQLTCKDLGVLTVGVGGCDNRATYKFVEGSGWVMDSAGQPPAGTAAPASRPAPAPAAG